MEIDKIALGHRIKSIRLEKSMNLKEFGFYIDNTSDSIVSRWEKGKSVPNAKRLKLIANAGGISVDELLYGDFESYCYGIFDSVNADMGYRHSGLIFLTDPDKKRAFYAKVFGYVKEYRYDYENRGGIYNLYHKSLADEIAGSDLTNEGSFNYLTNELEMLKNKLRKYYYTPAILHDNSNAKPGERVVIFSEDALREGADLELYEKQEKLLDVAKSEVYKLKVEYEKEEK